MKDDRTAVLKMVKQLQRTPLVADPMTLKEGRSRRSVMGLLYVVFAKIFHQYVKRGYEYCDGYNFRESLLRSDVARLEEKSS